LRFVTPPVSSTWFRQRCREDSEVNVRANAGAADACGPNEDAAHVYREPLAEPLEGDWEPTRPPDVKLKRMRMRKERSGQQGGPMAVKDPLYPWLAVSLGP
jgi:hypothetical protein